MKYLVNRETKEHIRYHEDSSLPLPGWGIVEADEEGWIPWRGGECPVPAATECFVQFQDGVKKADCCPEGWYWGRNMDEAKIIAYRPILSETAEKEVVKDSLTADSVFDRLKSAIAASESIPSIIAEIDALLPDGYCVEKREAQPAEDMSDWRNWREGDIIEVIENEGIAAIHLGDKHKILKTNALYVYIGTPSDGWIPSHFRFHSRPAKVAK